MPSYAFYPPADDAQDLIWRYTVKTWGETQAEKYVTGLHVHLQALAEKRKRWIPLPALLLAPTNLESEVWFSRYEHHYLFFRKLSPTRIGVISILHEKSDLPVRLRADLRRLEE